MTMDYIDLIRYFALISWTIVIISICTFGEGLQRWNILIWLCKKDTQLYAIWRTMLKISCNQQYRYWYMWVSKILKNRYLFMTNSQFYSPMSLYSQSNIKQTSFPYFTHMCLRFKVLETVLKGRRILDFFVLFIQ